MAGAAAITSFVDAVIPRLAPFADASWASWDHGIFVDAYAPSPRRLALDKVAAARRAAEDAPGDDLLQLELELALVEVERLDGDASATKVEDSASALPPSRVASEVPRPGTRRSLFIRAAGCVLKPA